MTAYFVNPEVPGQTVATRVVAALLDLLRDDLVPAEIDLFSDCRALPEDVEFSLDRLKVLAYERHERRRRGGLLQRIGARFGDPLMAVALDLRVEEHSELLRSFGPFSIHAEVYGKNESDSVISIDDSGASVVFRGNADVAREVEALAGLPRGSVQELH